MVCTRCFTFNHAPYIVDAMNGFVMQETTFPVITIIVDDASTDGEPEVIRNYLAEHFKLPYRTEETEYAHIICAKHKTNDNCEFVVFLLKYNHYSIKKSKFPYLSEWLDNAKYHALCEGDDYWNNDAKLQIQVEYMKSHKEVGMCYTKCRYYYQDKEKFARKSWGGQAEEFEEMIINNTVPTASVLYRNGLRQSYDDVIVPQSRGWILGDYPFWLYISKESKVKFINLETCIYRVLRHSASHRDSKEKREAFITSVTNIQHFFADRYMQSNLVRKDKKERALLMDSFLNGDYKSVVKYYKMIDNPGIKMFTKYLISVLLSNVKQNG